MARVRDTLRPVGPFWRAEHLLATNANLAPARLRPVRGGIVSLTFDDFPRSAWRAAGPVLAAHGVKATYYVCGGHEGATFEGHAQFTRDDLEGCASAGHEIGCHGFNHLAAAHLPADRFERAIEANRLYLRDRLGREATHFAYPYGHVSFAAKHIAAQRFVTARGVRGGFNHGSGDRALIRAVGFEQRKLVRAPIVKLLEQTAAAAGWLVLYSHDVSANPGPYGCTPADISDLLNAAARLGLAVETVSRAAMLVGLSAGALATQQGAAGAQQNGEIAAHGKSFEIAPIQGDAVFKPQA
jgi:peptidoglycan/xylan/chitin deacetylase (PgdA/CDA1 family)